MDLRHAPTTRLGPQAPVEPIVWATLRSGALIAIAGFLVFVALPALLGAAAT